MSSVFWLIFSVGTRGEPVLSEILSNEPGGRVRLEWIEIYNNSESEINLGDYILIVNSGNAIFPGDAFLSGFSFAVLARQALPENGSDSFEGFWGDSSGVWGDSEIENYRLFDLDFSLTNNEGSVAIKSIYGELVDSVSWDSPSDDGRSLERNDINMNTSGWHDCFDPAGSTPGTENSELPDSDGEEFFINIRPEIVSRRASSDPYFEIEVIIPPGNELSLTIFNESGLEIKTLVDGDNSEIQHLIWDLRNQSGKNVPPGLYLMTFRLSGLSEGLKIKPVVVAP